MYIDKLGAKYNVIKTSTEDINPYGPDPGMELVNWVEYTESTMLDPEFEGFDEEKKKKLMMLYSIADSNPAGYTVEDFTRFLNDMPLEELYEIYVKETKDYYSHKHEKRPKTDPLETLWTFYD